MHIDHAVKHEAYAMAEELADAIAPKHDSRHSETRYKLEKRLEAFAAAILQQAAKSGS